MHARAGHIALAERADGLLVVGGSGAEPAPPTALKGNLYAVDPRNKRVSKVCFDIYDTANQISILVVPGWAAGDPWSQRPMSDPSPQPVALNYPDIPHAPTGGDVVANQPASGCGAAGRAQRQPVLLIGLFALAVLRRRRAGRVLPENP